MTETARQMMDAARRMMENAQSQLEQSKKELEDATSSLKTVEQRWEVIDVDDESRNPFAVQTQAPIVDEHLIEIPARKTQILKFPVGCPVFYHFRAHGNDSKRLDVCSGVVKAVYLDYMLGRRVFKVEQDNVKPDKESSLDAVWEDGLAYAVQCPVNVKMGPESNNEQEGEIIFTKPVPDENGKSEASYIVRIFHDGNTLVEEGVVAQRINYRKNDEIDQNKNGEENLLGNEDRKRIY